MKQFRWVLLLLIIGIGCSKKSPKEPKAPLLSFPLKNSECSTGIDVPNTNTSEVEFQWQSSNNTETYELKVTNLNSNITQTISTEETSATLTITKGEPFSWFVSSQNSRVTQTASSEIWRFYNAGYETTHPPFPAEIITPKSGASIIRDLSNQIELLWDGADIDDDIQQYEVYLSTSSPPSILVATTNANKTNAKATVISGVLYYWKVVTTDASGNTSDSGIFEFKVL